MLFFTGKVTTLRVTPLLQLASTLSEPEPPSVATGIGYFPMCTTTLDSIKIQS